jgi:hypothetical protein
LGRRRKGRKEDDDFVSNFARLLENSIRFSLLTRSQVSDWEIKREQ